MNLKQIRLQKKLTQKDVAEYLGCSAVVYSRYETGERMPSLDVLAKIADCFQVTLDYLAGRQANTYSALSPFEQEMITASRKADQRACQDALTLLLTHSEQK